MKVSPSLVGRLVSIQLARDLYIIDYKAHVQTADKRSLLIGTPSMVKNQKDEVPVMMNILLGCDVLEVTEDSVKVALDINGNIVHNTIPSALILNIAEVVEFESEGRPIVTERRRAAAAPSGLVLP